jgi:hypothetical protein
LAKTDQTESGIFFSHNALTTVPNTIRARVKSVYTLNRFDELAPFLNKLSSIHVTGLAFSCTTAKFNPQSLLHTACMRNRALSRKPGPHGLRTIAAGSPLRNDQDFVA